MEYAVWVDEKGRDSVVTTDDGRVWFHERFFGIEPLLYAEKKDRFIKAENAVWVPENVARRIAEDGGIEDFDGFIKQFTENGWKGE